MILSNTRITTALGGCLGWSASLLFTNPETGFSSRQGPFQRMSTCISIKCVGEISTKISCAVPLLIPSLLYFFCQLFCQIETHIKTMVLALLCSTFEP